MKSKSFNQINIVCGENIKTGNVLFDKWFSTDGGIVPGSRIFITGTSGAGKTTLMINLMNWLQNHKSSLYSREMSISSLKQQVKNYNFKNNNAYFVDDEDCPNLDDYLNEIDIIKPEFVIVDSLQAIASADYPEMGEEKASVIVRQKLEKWCKENNSTLFLIGHNNKDNEFAGKNTNMQMVDAHMVLEYDQKTGTRRIFWGKKNRKGPLGELFYSIDNGEIKFSNSNPNYSLESMDFFVEFQKFIQTFVNNIKAEPEVISNVKKDLNNTSNEIYKTNKEDKDIYMTKLMPEIYGIFKKYGF